MHYNNQISVAFQNEQFFDRSTKENLMYPETELALKTNAKNKIRWFWRLNLLTETCRLLFDIDNSLFMSYINVSIK